MIEIQPLYHIFHNHNRTIACSLNSGSVAPHLTVVFFLQSEPISGIKTLKIYTLIKYTNTVNLLTLGQMGQSCCFVGSKQPGRSSRLFQPSVFHAGSKRKRCFLAISEESQRLLYYNKKLMVMEYLSSSKNVSKEC